MVSVEIVRGTDLFSSLADSDVYALATCFKERRYSSGQVVFRQGDPGDTMLVIASGRLLASTLVQDGSEASLSEMGPSEILGEMTFLDPAPRSATVTAVTDTVTYELSHDTMAILRHEAPKAASAILSAGIRGVTRRLRVLDERIEAELNRLAALDDGAART